MEKIGEDASLYDLIETRFGEDMAKYLGTVWKNNPKSLDQNS